MTAQTDLARMRQDFRAGSTRSMPVAGMIFWGVIGIASFRLEAQTVAWMALWGSGMIFPLGVLIDRMRGRKFEKAKSDDHLTKLFLRSLFMVVALWPLVMIAAYAAADPNLIVLGGAILMAVIWIPYGWAADDPVGLEHAVGRVLACYAAFLLAPEPYRIAAISAVTLLAYGYSLFRMRRD